jgi:membrane protein
MQLRVIIGKIWYLLRETFEEFIEDNAIKLSAALSYYTIFALPPLLIIIVNLSGLFFGADAVRGEIFGQINGLVGNDAAMQIQETIRDVSLSKNSVFASIFSIVILIIGASGIFTEIQDSLNYIWGIRTKPKRGLVKFVLNRLISFSMIGSVGFLLLVSLVINSLISFIGSRLAISFPSESIFLLRIINLVIVYCIITLLFSVIFKTLPNGKIASLDCIIGAAFTAFLFMIGKFLIGIYIGNFNIGSVYGAAGSIILVMVWVYYSAIIFYFGAEFTKVFAHIHGNKILPGANSIQLRRRT